MVGKRPRFLYRILQEVLRGRRCLRTGPLIAAYVKESGVHKHGLGSKLVQHLCINCDVDGALLIVNRLKEHNLFVAFPIDVLTDLSRRGRALDVYKFVVGAQDSLPAMDVVLYSVIIDSLCKDGYIGKALALCALARKKGVIFGVVTYNIILNGLCRQGCLIEAFRLFDSLERQDIVPTEITYGTMIDASVREGYLLDARELFDGMVLKSVKPTTHIYNALIDGYCKIGDVEESLKLLNDLDKRSLKPDGYTVSAIIDGFSRLGDMEGALQFFVSAREKGNSPDFLGFLYLIRGLYTKGRMEEARCTLREMLQSDTSVELINRVDVEIGNESIYGVLVNFCEQGSIHEAVVVLNEIAAILFPYKRSVISSRQNKGMAQGDPLPSEVCMKPLSFNQEKILDGNFDEVKQVVKFCNGSSERPQSFDFDVLYAEVEALCSVGDLAEASKLIKEMIFRLPNDCK